MVIDTLCNKITSVIYTYSDLLWIIKVTLEAICNLVSLTPTRCGFDSTITSRTNFINRTQNGTVKPCIRLIQWYFYNSTILRYIFLSLKALKLEREQKCKHKICVFTVNYNLYYMFTSLWQFINAWNNKLKMRHYYAACTYFKVTSRI